MAQNTGNISTSNLAARRHHPPAPLRTHSETNTLSGERADELRSRHARHKSTSVASDASRGSPGYLRRASEQPRAPSKPSRREYQAHLAPESIPEITPDGLMSPPLTPIKSRDSTHSDLAQTVPELITYDFFRIDYAIEQARVLGRGLWSIVLLADGKVASPRGFGGISPTPPASPEMRYPVSLSSMFAVKVAARSDAVDVFRQEAKVLSQLTRLPSSSQYVVPFHGFDERCSSLVFEAVIGGSLENLTGRLGQMTEVARHVELVNLFPGLADDLISGLDFMHAAGVVHADIKPANVLLDISTHYSLPRPVVRARYIDFSASFRLQSDDSTANSGGSWDYLAPEQMRIQKEFSTPTLASDAWALGITLLSLIVGTSPYAAACGNNAFMVREAIKTGDPFGFARMTPVAGKRMAACQHFIDICRQALKKDRERRLSASAWKGWLANQEFGI